MSCRARSAAAAGLTAMGAEAARAGRPRVTAGNTSSTSSSRDGCSSVTARALSCAAASDDTIHLEKLSILLSFNFAGSGTLQTATVRKPMEGPAAHAHRPGYRAAPVKG